MSSYMPQCSTLDTVFTHMAIRVRAKTCKAPRLERVPLSSTIMRERHLMADGSWQTTVTWTWVFRPSLKYICLREASTKKMGITRRWTDYCYSLGEGRPRLDLSHLAEYYITQLCWCLKPTLHAMHHFVCSAALRNHKGAVTDKNRLLHSDLGDAYAHQTT